jgi:uncharacterized protein YdaU (DUF1376 family)
VNYYRRYVGDYLRDTARLSMLEHGAYNLLLDYYYAEERPIPLDLAEVYRMVRAITPEERRAVGRVLTTFFVRADDGYRQKRVDHEIDVSQKARENGKGGGRPVKTGSGTGQETGSETGSQTGSITGQGGGSGHPPTTNLQPPTASHHPKSISGAGAPLDGFEILWKTYPRRAGNNPKRAAERAYRARLIEKHTAREILDGAARYAKFVAATGKLGTEYVMRASTFLGADKPFLQAWTPPAAAGGPSTEQTTCDYCSSSRVGIVNGIAHCRDHAGDAMDDKPRLKAVA